MLATAGGRYANDHPAPLWRAGPPGTLLLAAALVVIALVKLTLSAKRSPE